MTGLRRSFLFMIIHLAIVFNLEKFDLSSNNVIDLQWFLYLLVIFVIVATLTVRPLQIMPAYMAVGAWALLYGLLRVALFNQRPIIGGIYTYLTVTEVSILSITVFLSYELARSIHEIDEIIEKISLPMLGQRVLRIRDADEEIKTEFIRSRRHNRPLSVMVVTVDPNTSPASMERTIREIQKSMVIRYLNSSLARMLAREARRTDLILEGEDSNSFVLLCPETTSEGAEILSSRLQELAGESLGIQIRCGAASFPDEALTFDDLLQKAEFSLANPQNYPLYSYDQSEPVRRKEK